MNPVKANIEILIISKYTIFRKGLCLLLLQQCPDASITELTGTTPDEQNLPGAEPSLVIVEIDKDSRPRSIEFLNYTKHVFPSAGIIVIDEYADFDSVIDYLQAGVNGYIHQEGNLPDFIRCVSDVLEGKKYIASEILVEVLKKKKGQAAKSSPKKRSSRLTANEHAIATQLSKGVKPSAIAKMRGRKISTISTIKATIFRKLKVDNIVSLREVLLLTSTEWSTV